MINVLIVEDSLVESQLLQRILEGDADIKVIGRAANGQDALRMIARHKPDVITMDIMLPGMDGIEVTRQIMATDPLPIVIVSSHIDSAESTNSIRAIEAGAVATLTKPHGPGHPEHQGQALRLVRTVKAMAEVKMVKRRMVGKPTPAPITDDASTVTPSQEFTVAASPQGRRKVCDLVVIGASTGGPPVLQTILQRLPANFPAPILIVQHMSPGFTQGLCDWLAQVTKIPVKLAQQDETPLPGHVYLAPDDYHLGISTARRMTLHKSPVENGLRPAVSCLFRTVAGVCPLSTVGILLTGMGRDGAVELKLLRDRGAVTIAQDQTSSLVHGMPGEAIKLGAAQHILPPERIADLLSGLC